MTIQNNKEPQNLDSSIYEINDGTTSVTLLVLFWPIMLSPLPEPKNKLQGKQSKQTFTEHDLHIQPTDYQQNITQYTTIFSLNMLFYLEICHNIEVKYAVKKYLHGGLMVSIYRLLSVGPGMLRVWAVCEVCYSLCSAWLQWMSLPVGPD